MIRMTLLIVAFSLSIIANCQPGHDICDFLGLTIKQILAPDSSIIIYSPDLNHHNPMTKEQFNYSISYYRMKCTNDNNFDSIQEKIRYESNYWKCDYALAKAHEACRKKPEDRKYPNRDSVFNYWSSFANQVDSDSLFSQYITGRRDSLELDSMRSEILYRGYTFGLNKFYNELIVIEEQKTGKQMKVLIVGHSSCSPPFRKEFYIENIIFRPGNMTLDVNKNSIVKTKKHNIYLNANE